MQNRREGENSRAKIANLHKSNGRDYQCIESSDSSDEYEDATHISYHFRRWAKHISSVSNNVTNRLRGLLGSHPSSNATSNHSIAESCQDDSNANSWTTSSGIIASPNRIENWDCNTRQHHERARNYYRSTSGENYCRYGQKFCSHVTGGHRMRHVTANEVEARPDFIRGHGVAAYRPVLILPRLHQGVNRQPIDTGSYQSRKHMLRCRNMHGDECADGWYQHYHHSGERWGYEGSRGRDNYSALTDRRQIPERLSSLMNDPEIEDLRRTTPRTFSGRRRIEPCDYDFESVKHYCDQISDLHSESYKNGHGSVSPIHDTRRLRKQNSNRGLEFTTDNEAKNIVWGLQMSDITSQEPSSKDPSTAALSAKPFVVLDIEENNILVDRNPELALANHGSVEVPVKGDVKPQEIVSPVHDIGAAKHSQNSRYIQTEKTSSEAQTDDLVNGDGIKWSSVMENSVDSLSQSLRDRADTLANVHSLDTGPANRRGETGLAKECIVASFLAGTYLPQCLVRRDKIDPNFVAKNEDRRPSFSERMQDIWRDGKPKVLRSSSGHQTSASRYNFKSEQEVQLELSLSGLNQQPVLREYLGEYNNAVTLAKILERLIESKSRTDITSSMIPQAPTPPPRLGRKPRRKQSKTCLQVNVGVQKSTPMSTTACQERVSHPTSRRLIKKQRSRSGFRRKKPRVSELPVETPRPLQVFSGRSIIPISSIQFAPVVEPLSNLHGFTSTRCSPSSTRRSSFFVKDERPVARGIESSHEDDINRQIVDEYERRLSLLVEKIEEKLESTQQMSQQRQYQHFTQIPVQESKVAEARADAKPGKGMSTKGPSWWKTRFRINKRSTLKEKMASFLKCISKKRTDDETNCYSQNCALGEARNDNIIPIPPVRVRGKCNAGGTKSSKSIQWELSEDVPRSIEMIDSFQVTENQQSNKSISVGPSITKATVTRGTNTEVNKSYNTSPKLFLNQNRRALVSHEVNHVSENAFVELPNELPVPGRPLIESDIVEDAKAGSEFKSLKEISLPSRDNIESSIDPCLKEERDSDELNKLAVSRSSSSKIHLAINREPVNLSNASLTISGRRPSTALILVDSSNHSLRSDAFLGESEAGKSVKGRECANQEARKFFSFKHNRSSLLRAHNSMSRKYTMGQSHLSRITIADNYVERKSISKVVTSPGQIDDEIAPPKTSSTDETPFPKPHSEKRSDDEKCDTKINSLPLELSDFPGNHSTPSTSEHVIKQTVVKKIPVYDLSEVSLLKTKDLTHDKEIMNRPVSPPWPKPIDPKQSSNNQTKGPLRNGKSINGNSEHSKDEQRSPKASTYPSDVQPCSSHADKDDETAVNWEPRKLGDNEGIGPPENLRKENKYGEILSTLCEKDQKLLIQVVAVSQDPNPKSVDFREFVEMESNNTCCSNSNASSPESDTKSVFNENSIVREQPESLFARRIKIDDMKTTLNEETKLQPALAFSTAMKTERYFFKDSDMPVQQSVLRSKETHLERSRRPCLQFKPIPSSRLSPQLGIGKSSVKSARLSNKNIIPASMAVSRFNSADNRSIGNPSEVSSVLDDAPSPVIKSPESQDSDSVAAHKTSETVSLVTGSKKNHKQKLTKMSKARNKSTEEIFKMIRKVIDVAINESVNVGRRTDLRMVSSRQCIPRSTPSNSEKSSELSIDSLEPDRVQTTSRPRSSIRRKIRPAAMAGIDEKYYQSCSLNHKEEIGSSCSQKQPDIWSKEMQLHLNPRKEPKIISGVMTDERQDDCPGIQPSRKFLVTGKPSLKSQTSEISALLNIKSAKDPKDENKFDVGRSQISCGHTVKSSGHDNKFEATVVPPKIVVDKNRKELMPFEMEDNQMQSIVAFDLVKIVDKPEKLPTLIFYVYPGSSVESAESRLQGGMSKEYENGKLLNIQSNSRVMNDENNAKSKRDDRNVKINNKVLEEKVKSSKENGVPFKTITITDPSIIKHNWLNENSQMVDKIRRDQDLKTMGSEVQDKPSTKFYNNSQDLFLDDRSEGQCSHTTWVSHKNQDIILKSKIPPETSSKSGNAELYIPEDIAQVIDTRTSAVGQSNIILNMTRLELNKNQTRRRGSLIPRYKRTTLNPSTKSDSQHEK